MTKIEQLISLLDGCTEDIFLAKAEELGVEDFDLLATRLGTLALYGLLEVKKDTISLIPESEDPQVKELFLSFSNLIEELF